MPSKALGKLEGAMMKDVDRIIETHDSIQNGSPGNMGLGHLPRAGVLLLCAAWELYIEELLLEVVEKNIDRCMNPTELPDIVQKTIAKYVKDSKHQLKPLYLAGDGWKNIYIEIANEYVSSLNTPKQNNIDVMFHEIVGIKDLSTNWSDGSSAINDFVKARGDVAHRGSDAGNIRINTLRNTYKPQICKAAVETDNAISTYIRSVYPSQGYPWKRRAI